MIINTSEAVESLMSDSGSASFCLQCDLHGSPEEFTISRKSEGTWQLAKTLACGNSFVPGHSVTIEGAADKMDALAKFWLAITQSGDCETTTQSCPHAALAGLAGTSLPHCDDSCKADLGSMEVDGSLMSMANKQKLGSWMTLGAALGLFDEGDESGGGSASDAEV